MTTVQAPPRERPILFSAEMIRAILDGTKTETRRVVTNSTSVGNFKASELDLSRAWVDGPKLKSYLTPETSSRQGLEPDEVVERLYCRWEEGDRLWVRETAWYDRNVIPILGYRRAFFEGGDVRKENPNGGESAKQPGLPQSYTAELFALNPSIVRRTAIHMPRWASRITLEITRVGVERLRDIDRNEAQREGFLCSHCKGYNREGGCMLSDEPTGCVGDFRALWDSVNAKRGFGWDANPWVWKISFRRVV